MTPRCWRGGAITAATPAPRQLRRRSPAATGPSIFFALEQALALDDVYHEKVSACDVRIEAVLKELSIDRGHRSICCRRHVGEPIK